MEYILLVAIVYLVLVEGTKKGRDVRTLPEYKMIENVVRVAKRK